VSIVPIDLESLSELTDAGRVKNVTPTYSRSARGSDLPTLPQGKWKVLLSGAPPTVSATLAVLFSGLLLAATPTHAVTLKPFSAIGSGAPTADDCSGSSTGQCSVTFGGTLEGSQIGNASVTGTLSVNHSAAAEICLDNPNCNDQCFPASGTGVITTKDGSTITFGQDGLLCPVPPDSTGGENFNGSFIVTGGTKKFASEIGSGLAGAAISADGSVVTFTLTGTIGKP